MLVFVYYGEFVASVTGLALASSTIVRGEENHNFLIVVSVFHWYSAKQRMIILLYKVRYTKFSLFYLGDKHFCL